MIEPRTFYPQVIINKMNTDFTVKLAVKNVDPVIKQILKTTSKLIAQDLGEIDRKLSPNRPDSLVSKYRKGQHDALAQDPMFQEVFGQCSIAEAATSGYFNAFYDGKFNPDGLIKGWAIETLFQLHLKPLLIDPDIVGVALEGDGDIQLASKEGSDFHWNIDVQDPCDSEEVIAEYNIRNGALATSGMSKTVRKISHSSSSIKQVTIVANGMTEADVWAIAGITAGTNYFKKMIESSELTGMLVDKTEGTTAFARGNFNHKQSA